MHILLVEDDPNSASYIEHALSEAGHRIDLVVDGRNALNVALGRVVDVIVLDRMLPVLDGLEFLRRIRAIGIETPVLIVSALGDVNERVEGLRAGADDYLAKPFSITELLARVDALGRRRSAGGAREKSVLKHMDVEMDLIKRTVHRKGHLIELQQKDFQILEFFLRRPDQVITRSMLLEGVWGFHGEQQTNVIDVHVSRLRSKLDFENTIPLIQTVRGSGYRLAYEPR